MITFVTWVNDKQQYSGLLKSVKFDCEFLPLGQSFGSLSNAYAFGQQQAKGDIVVYCHQDIIIHDSEFEFKLNKFFETTENTGVCGVIGNNVLSKSSWWIPMTNCRGYIRQSDRTGQIPPRVFNFGRGTQKAKQMDGCFLVTNRKDWEFPELPGIHFLDLWWCNLSLERGFDNWIIDLDVEHTSWGETDSDDYKNNYKIYLDRWQNFLNGN